MKISIAMCTYNGAAYLREQLDSIAAQTRLPDELVVCDDCSTDSTREILEAFKLEAPFPVRLYVNEQNLRTTKNFEKAIRLCEGEIIALSDQDDVWHPEKLTRMEAAFQKSSQIGLVFTDLEVVNERLRPLGYRAWQSDWVEFGRKEQQLLKKGKALDVLLTRNVVTGAAAAFRASYKEVVVPIPVSKNELHDHWIALVIAAVANVAAIDQPLVKYRSHSNQQAGLLPPVLTRRPRERAARQRENYKIQQHLISLVLERLRARNHKHEYRTAIAALEDRLAHTQVRANLHLEKYVKRASRALLELLTLRYHRFQPPYSSAWYEAGHDLLPYRILDSHTKKD